jgi:hypothetical protein
MTPQDANDLVKRILGAYPTQRMKLSSADISGMVISYTAGLIDLDFEIARAAVDRANKTSEMIPTIAKIRAEVVELARGGKRSGAEAWGDVLRAVGTFGIYQEPRFADPLVAEAVGAVGWRAICQSDETDSSPRAKFAAAYDRLAASTRKEAQASRGAGAPQLEAGARSIGELMAAVLPKEPSDG